MNAMEYSYPLLQMPWKRDFSSSTFWNSIFFPSPVKYEIFIFFFCFKQKMSAGSFTKSILRKNGVWQSTSEASYDDICNACIPSAELWKGG